MKKFLALALALAMALSLVACGGSGSGTADDTNTPSASDTTDTSAAGENGDTTDDTDGETVVLKIAASPSPHAEILEQVKPILAEEGIDLQITEYADYVVPNTAVEDGLEDVNYFQHTPYLDNFNEENGTHLVSVAAIHYEPMGIFPGKTASLEELADGATVAVPNDATNEARALQLLEAAGLITLSEDAGLSATPKDITENPKNLNFLELEAAQLSTAVQDVDIAVINGNYAIDAGFSVAEDALAVEDATSEAAQTYANVIVVKEGNEDNPAVQALVAALESDTIRDFINNTYDGAVQPIF
jgi:D-methionine transport system substrate-binding protein